MNSEYNRGHTGWLGIGCLSLGLLAIFSSAEAEVIQYNASMDVLKESAWENAAEWGANLDMQWDTETVSFASFELTISGLPSSSQAGAYLVIIEPIGVNTQYSGPDANYPDGCYTTIYNSTCAPGGGDLFYQPNYGGFSDAVEFSSIFVDNHQLLSIEAGFAPESLTPK